jgi:hypothetical protein
MTIFIQYNADLRALDQEGCSALWYAKQGGSQGCFDILINAGLDPGFGLLPNSGTYSSNRRKSDVQSRLTIAAQQKLQQQNGHPSDAFDQLPASII